MIEFNRRVVLFGAAALVSCAFSLRLLQAQQVATRPVALRGYDPVSYFTEGRPQMGSAEFAFSYEDAVYNFASESHRDMFKVDPEKYAPQFNGYCAISISKGVKIEPDPEAWAIKDGKLYVFSGKAGVPMFNQHTSDIVSKANRSWSDLRSKN
jgi:YHS domain-containing protein